MSFSNLEPREVFDFFKQISEIPRGSGNEKRISDYLVQFAINHGLEYVQDESYNVIIKKSATKGYEKSPCIILQGHMDMVCEKNKDTVHDFLNDPIKLIVDGDFLKANGTTLGGDNGVAIAYSLALLASDDIEHPPLEALFTVNEEVGMDGARNIDTSNLNGKMLINIDSEEEGEFLASCAGGIRATIHISIAYVPVDSNVKSYIIKLRGLKGGHSGMEIDKQRANANKLMGRILSSLYHEYGIKIADLNGGAKDNAIPREADMVVVTTADKLALENTIINLQAEYQFEFRNAETDISIKLEEVEMPKNVFDDNTTKSVIDTLILIPNGVKSMSLDIKGLVESSTNIGVVKVKNQEVTFTSAIRSSVATRKKEILNQIYHLAGLVKATVTELGDYPAWEYNANSKLRDTFLQVYNDMYGEKAKVTAIHAGLECGLLSEKMKDADMISFGPNMYDVHTPDERVSISSVARTWDFLKAVLRELQ